MARLNCVVLTAVFMAVVAAVKANQCQSCGECLPSCNQPNNLMSMLQTSLQIHDLKDNGGVDSPNSLHEKALEDSPKPARTKSALSVKTQVKHATRKSPIKQLNHMTCVEAVLVEPRRSRAIARAAKSALGSNEVDLLTLAHGELNSDYVSEVVAQSSALTAAWQGQRLRYLNLHVSDLGGDAVGSSKDGLLLHTDTKAGHVDGVGYRNEYSRLLKSVGFWSQLRCDRIVIMQSDSLFCSGSKVRLSEYFGYDFVGGPWGVDLEYLNGGFSFRSRPKSLACLAWAKQHPDEAHHTYELVAHAGCVLLEDCFFQFCPLLKKPPANMTERFAVSAGRTIPREVPLGVHQPWNGHPQSMQVCSGAPELQKEQDLDH